MKVCYKCKQEKSLFDFHKKKDSKDGHQTRCKECFKKINLDWYNKNKDRKFALSKKWYQENKSRKKETQKKWVEKNRQKYLLGCSVRRHTRRARELNAEGYFLKKDIKNLCELQKGRCAGCRVKLTKYHIDHIVPLALGGTNWTHNLQILCVSCNLSKHAKHPIDWANENGRLL